MKGTHVGLHSALNLDLFEGTDRCRDDRLMQGQGNGAFVEGVQKAIATELKVGIADMTNQEKKQLIKQYSKQKQ